MTQHYTKNTVEASAWCKRCNAFTTHRVDAGKTSGLLGPCRNCIAKLDAAHDAPKAISAVEPQRTLFGEST